MNDVPNRPAALDPQLLAELLRSIASIRFGTVELTIHDGRVVQIERRERIRLTETDSSRSPTRT